MKNLHIISFLHRYWIILLIFALATWAALSEGLFQALGTLIYLPSLAFGSVIVALLIRHVFFAQTLDDDVTSGLFVATWHSMDPERRLVLNLSVLGVIFLGVCYIAGALIH